MSSTPPFIGREAIVPIYRGGGRYDKASPYELRQDWGVLDPPWASTEQRFRSEFGRDAQRHWFGQRGASVASFSAVMKQKFVEPIQTALHQQSLLFPGSDETSVRRPWYAGIMDWWSSLWRK